MLVVPLLFGTAQQAPPEPGSAGDIPAVSAGAGKAFRAAAAAMRRHDCGAALAELAPVAAGGMEAAPAPPAPGTAGTAGGTGGTAGNTAGTAGGTAGGTGSASTAAAAAANADATLAGLVSGLYAQACGQVSLAEERLFSARMPGGPLEDWRLLQLSDTAHARGHVLVARAALAKLLGDYPASPLRAQALVKAAALSWERGDADGAMALVRQARREGLRGEARTRLDVLAWEIGTRRGDAGIRAEAARELLVSSPTMAAQLGAAEVFRRPDGTLSLASALSAAQLKQRAQALLALQLEPSALTTLDEVAPADRDLPWVLLKAEVLTRAHRGKDAMTLLQPLQSAAPTGIPARSMAAVEWALAQASDDLAAAQHGRSSRVQAERRKLRLAARLHLRSAAELDADRELTIRALRALYAHLIEEDQFAPALDALNRLHTLDPKDVTGANLLWTRGWQDFTRRDYRGAVGYWTRLDSLYPADSSGRRARYWTARCFEELGEHDRAHQLYAELAAADTSDFYRRNAVVRLARWKAPAPESPESPARAAEPWPYDPTLMRAQLLTDLGLDALAQSELDLARDRAQPHAVSALQAVILARSGDRRQSVLAIRDAFPALGGPFQAAVPEEALKLYYPLDYAQPIRASAVANGLSPALVFGVIRQESAFDANALSRAGASGLMQLMPGTARELARGLGLAWSRERLIDPAWNVEVGASYLRQVLAMFDGNVELGLAGYNGGPYRIKRLWREARTSDLDRFVEGLSIEESKVYVKRILVLSDSYRRLYPHAAG